MDSSGPPSVHEISSTGAISRQSSQHPPSGSPIAYQYPLFCKRLSLSLVLIASSTIHVVVRRMKIPDSKHLSERTDRSIRTPRAQVKYCILHVSCRRLKRDMRDLRLLPVKYSLGTTANTPSQKPSKSVKYHVLPEICRFNRSDVS